VFPSSILQDQFVDCVVFQPVRKLLERLADTMLLGQRGASLVLARDGPREDLLRHCQEGV
jgi:hypothetical protein